MQRFVKRDAGGSASLLGEAAGLRWLAEAEAKGGLHVATVVSASETELVEERIGTRAPTAGAARGIGASLARTHAAGAPGWGCPPPGWEGSYRIGRSLTPTVLPTDAPSRWGLFYAAYRIEPSVRALRDTGAFGPAEVAVFDRLSARLAAGIFDAPQPALVCGRGSSVARLHGDLWSGNLLWDANPANATGGALIDAMAHGGHAETDLAMLALFGCPYLEVILAAYDEVSPLADGWRERVALHQVAPLLLHCVLFGESYHEATLRAARRYL